MNVRKRSAVFQVVAAVRLRPGHIILAHGDPELPGVAHLEIHVEPEPLPLHKGGLSVLVRPTAGGAIRVHGEAEGGAVGQQPLSIRILAKTGLLQQLGRRLWVVLPRTIAEGLLDRLGIIREGEPTVVAPLPPAVWAPSDPRP